MNDAELLSDFAAGDEQALDTLITKYFSTVYSAAMRQVGDYHLAQDVAQSVFILFARKAVSLSRDVSVGGWLLRTTRFVSRDALKQMNRRLRREDRAIELSSAAGERDPDWAILAPWIDDALHSLSEKEKACILARFVEGRSLREIGEQFRISEDAAQKRVSRSLDKMRAFLQRHGVKAGVGVLAGLLSTEFARAAEPDLLELAINSVHAVLRNAAISIAGAQLADTVTRTLRRRRIFRFAGIAAGAALIIASFFIWRGQGSPVPRPVLLQVSNPRIAALGAQWGQLDVRAATLVRAFTPPPAPNDPRFADFQQQMMALTQDGERIRTEYLSIAPDGGSVPQLAEFLTSELIESVGLNRSQQTAIFTWLRDELASATTLADGRAALLRDKAVLAQRIRQSLSPTQRQKFDFTYREDFLALFTFVKLKQP